MYAEKVDFDDFESLVADSDVCWYTADRGDEFAALGGANPYVPVFFPAWRCQCPTEDAHVNIELQVQTISL